MQKTTALDLCRAENHVSVKLQACGAGSNSIRRTEVSTLCTRTANIVRQSTQRDPGRRQYRVQPAPEPNIGTVYPGTHTQSFALRAQSPIKRSGACCARWPRSTLSLSYLILAARHIYVALPGIDVPLSIARVVRHLMQHITPNRI